MRLQETNLKTIHMPKPENDFIVVNDIVYSHHEYSILQQIQKKSLKTTPHNQVMENLKKALDLNEN